MAVESNNEIWIVTLGDNVSPESVTTQLKRLGIVILQSFDQIGSLEVQCPAALASDARKLPGVADVSRSITFDIGPGDSQIS